MRDVARVLHSNVQEERIKGQWGKGKEKLWISRWLLEGGSRKRAS
jgi:hypothetical protein